MALDIMEEMLPPAAHPGIFRPAIDLGRHAGAVHGPGTLSNIDPTRVTLSAVSLRTPESTNRYTDISHVMFAKFKCEMHPIRNVTDRRRPPNTMRYLRQPSSFIADVTLQAARPIALYICNHIIRRQSEIREENVNLP